MLPHEERDVAGLLLADEHIRCLGEKAQAMVNIGMMACRVVFYKI